MTRLFQPIPRVVPGDDAHHLLRGVMRMDVPPGTRRVDLVTSTRLRLSLIDSGDTPAAAPAKGDTAVHVLWQRDERGAFVEIEGERLRIAPGDTISIPAADRWSLSPRQIAVVTSTHARRLATVVGPTHGEESFDGYNRRTRCATVGGYLVDRWKITGPQTFDQDMGERILVGLTGDVALTWSGGTELLTNGTCRVIPAGAPPITVVPNGLGYVVALSHPAPD